jgi:hypothetical protein
MKATDTSHSCGWAAASGSVACPCAHEGCPAPAVVRIKTHGWANLCMEHYMAHHQAKAVAYCHEKGLYTTEAQIKHCSPILHKIFRHRKDGMVEF